LFFASDPKKRGKKQDPIFDIFDTLQNISRAQRGKLDENQKNPYFVVKNNFAKLSLEEHGLIRVYRES
jgi:hypothetical protein